MPEVAGMQKNSKLKRKSSWTVVLIAHHAWVNHQ
jgi:hypothetical protein